MSVNVNELIAALPADENEDAALDFATAPEQLSDLMADISQRRVPVNSLHRLWMAGELSAQIALAYFALWVRKWFAGAEAQQQRVMETNLRLALKLFHRLAYMRGAMTKIGQAVGSLPNVLPEQIVDSLERLHFEAPPMHFALIREVFENESGKSPDDAFESFNREAFAAASIGQVHRARLKSGEEVAVKIQYPGVARTVDADFRNLGALLFPMRMGKEWASVQSSFDEIHRMLKQEMDYEREAESLEAARTLFTETDSIVVPRVFPEHSGKRVLTMELLLGLRLPEFLATNPSQELRNSFGTRMYVAWKKIYDANMNYADPSAGNYLFMNDGRLGLLDIGCVQHYGPEEQALTQLTLRLPRDIDAFPELLRRGAGAGDKDLSNPEYVRLMRDLTDWILEPVRHKGAFDFGDPDHLKSGFERFTALVRKRYTRSHPMYLYLYRSILGLRAVLYRLRAQVDVAALF